MTPRRSAIFLLAALTALAVPGARAETPVLQFACDGRPGTIGSMENEYIVATTKGACWFHIGHHTYDLRAPHRIGVVQGSLFSVEVELSPPTEFSGIDAALHFEGSPDGLVWTSLSTMPFDLTRDRQAITFSFDAGGFVARYLRIRQPQSAAQGLAGYLDSSAFSAEAEPVAAPAAPGVSGTRSYACAGGIMEAFHVAHPCWFGGVNRYDSPSTFHTYPIGPSRLDRVAGTASFLPWRSDDYTQNGGSRSSLDAFVQVSADSERWTTLGKFSGNYGVPLAFDFTALGGIPAQYVRIVAEYHKGYKTHPALKHVRGMLLGSALELTGSPA